VKRITTGLVKQRRIGFVGFSRLTLLDDVGPHEVMVADELASGRLVPLFESAEVVDHGYWLAWPKNSRKRALIDRLASWLSEEMLLAYRPLPP
jgi:DNA-binding transcriptional LysR family regulator